MKMNIKNIALLAASAMLTLAGCTKDFEEINTDPYGIADSEVSFSDLFNEAQLSVYYNQSNGNWEYQLIQNLNADLWSGYFAIPTAYNGGLNNDNYYMMNGWNGYTLNYMLLHVIKPTSQLLKVEDLADDLKGIALILKVAGAHKMVDTYGPAPYSEAMKGGISVKYDSEEEAYTQMLSELEEATSCLTSWLDANGGADKSNRISWDKMCNKSQKTWLQLGNTLRLRLAMRLAMVAPALAKSNAEAACANKYGLLKDVDVEVKDGNTRNPLGVILRDYNDCAISANWETILKGYNDPRLEATTLGVGWNNKGDIFDQNGNATGWEGKIKGIRNGLKVQGTFYKTYSIPIMPLSGGPYSTDMPLPIMSRAEASFLQAEGKLRGWNTGSGSVKEYYQEGIRHSFGKYGLDDKVAAYMEGTSTQIDYEDPHNPANNIAAVNDLPVKFMDEGTDEQKLGQIITQKWIACFPEGLNAWAEYRRTGYPHLFPIPSDNCNVQSEYLAGSKEDLIKYGVRRLPFAEGERNANPAGLQSGKDILSARGQKDAIDERIWWDTGKNF